MKVFACVSTCIAFLLFPSLSKAQEVFHDRDQAASLLEEMIGTWQFRLADAPAETPSILGVRTIRAGVDEITLEWEESLQVTGAGSRGYLGYDPVAGRYYMIGVHDNPQAKLSLLTGTPEADGRTIRWEPVSASADRQIVNKNLITSVMQLDAARGIMWRAYDDRWAFRLVPQ